MPDRQKTPSQKYPVLIFLALVAAGLAGNYFKYELFFNIQFIFGGVFALLVLQLLGFGPGILAAILISSITFLLWNHPYAIVILTAEVIAVGWLSRRKGLSLVIADAIYWLCLGMPLVYLFYHGVMQLPLSNALITMVKQALNGVVNALAARLLFMALSLRVKERTLSFREIIFHLLTLFMLGPSLLVLTQESKTEFAATDQQIRASLLRSSARTGYNLEQWLHGHLAQIVHVAKLATMSEPLASQQGIEEIHAENQDFLRLGLLDQDATIIAFSPLIDELGRPNLGRNFADRPFIPMLKQTLKPMLSEVVMGRINEPEPVVSMLAPVVKDGVYGGYAIGVLDLKGLLKVIEIEMGDPGKNYTLLDRNNKVIISSHPDLKRMEVFVRPTGELRRLDNGISQWLPLSQQNISLSERWPKSLYINEITLGAMAEWKLILEQPVAPFQEKLYTRYSQKLGLLLLVLAMALALAEVVSRKLIVSLEQLKALTTGLPEKLLAAEALTWPQSAITESAGLLVNFRTMATALSGKFNEIKELNINLEGMIHKRTQEVRQLATRYQTLMQTASDGIHVLDEQGNVAEVNDSFCRMLGYTRQELLRLNVQDWEAQYTPEELRTGIPQLIRHPALFTTRHRRKDGEIREVEISAGGVSIDGNAYLFNASRDITDRKRAEKEREQFYTFFQTSTDMMCIADPNGAFLTTNPACSERLGYSAAELVARPFIDFIHPEDKQPTIDEMARQMQCGYSLNFENRYRCKDGSYCWLAWRANFNKDEGLTYATARDITERKQAEEALRAASLYSRNLIETSLDPLVTINAAGRITDVNAATEKITGMSRQQLIGSDFADYVTEPEMARKGYLKVFAQGQIVDYPLAIRHASGAITEVLYNASLYRDEDGKVLGVFAAARDITERKRTEEALLRSVKEKEVMLKEIHHRVKNNMQVVYSLLNLQAKSIGDPAVRAMFEESRNRVSSMSLIHEKLYRSADLAFIDFKEYLQSLLAGIADTYHRPDVTCAVDMAPLALDINAGIPCGLIVNELASNSLKHAFPEGRQGTITIGINQNSTGQNVLTVADNGIGFPAGLDFKNTASLGLQLVTVLSGQLNGVIELVQGEGTKFVITFPGA